MNGIKIVRQNGGIGRSAGNRDHVSALLFYASAAAISSIKSGAASVVEKYSYLQEAEAAGITGTSTDSEVKMMHYQVSEAFRMNPGIELWVGVYPAAAESGDETYDEIGLMQRAANGEIRQLGLYGSALSVDAAMVALVQAQATALEAEQMPLSVVVGSNGDKATLMSTDLKKKGLRNVSVVAGRDLDAGYAGLVGLAIGMLSAAGVHESISWVGKFASGISHPGIDGSVGCGTLTTAEKETIDGNGYMFLTKYPADSDSYMSDSQTLDDAGSDYCYVERERTMDKAVRGVYAALLPYVGAPMYVAEDGTLRGDSLASLENVCNVPLEAMESAGELSGYKAEIDAAQDVLGSSEIKIVIKQVAVGASRVLSVKTGYTKSVED